MEQLLTQFAMKMFENELKNPNSSVTQQFKEMLFGGPNNEGAVTNAIDSMTPEGQKKAKKLAEKEAKKADKQCKQELEKAFNNYRRSDKEAFQDNAMQAAGTASKAAGNIFGLYDNLLGDALLAVSGSMTTPGYTNHLAMAPSIAAGQKFKGGMKAGIGNAVGDIIGNIGKDLSMNRETDRQTRLMLESQGSDINVPSGYWDLRKQANNIVAGR